jgi:hypothetical protein
MRHRRWAVGPASLAHSSLPTLEIFCCIEGSDGVLVTECVTRHGYNTDRTECVTRHGHRTDTAGRTPCCRQRREWTMLEILDKMLWVEGYWTQDWVSGLEIADTGDTRMRHLEMLDTGDIETRHWDTERQQDATLGDAGHWRHWDTETLRQWLGLSRRDTGHGILILQTSGCWAGDTVIWFWFDWLF